MLRIYHPYPLQLGQSIRLDKAAAHHVSRVLRAKLNDTIHLFDGLGSEVQAIIQQIDKHDVKLLIEQDKIAKTESTFAIHLGQALLHREKMDWVIQKSVELGVTSITPIITERSQPRLSEERYTKRQQHWQNIIINACEQCGRAKLPELHAPCDFSVWVEQYQGILCDPIANTTIKQLKQSDVAGRILIGSEGGLSNEEIEYAKSQDWQTIQLGTRILRTETAAIAIIAILQAQFGDIG